MLSMTLLKFFGRKISSCGLFALSGFFLLSLIVLPRGQLFKLCIFSNISHLWSLFRFVSQIICIWLWLLLWLADSELPPFIRLLHVSCWHFHLLQLQVCTIFISVILFVLVVHTAEMFPTSIRNSALGTSSTSSHVGSIMAPYVVDFLVCCILINIYIDIIEYDFQLFVIVCAIAGTLGMVHSDYYLRCIDCNRWHAVSYASRNENQRYERP